MKRVLIIDALNAYLRAYIVNPSLSLNGQPIGGIKGFFMILQKIRKLIQILQFPKFENGSLIPRPEGETYS